MEKKPYSPPELVVLGDVVDITRDTSSGFDLDFVYTGPPIPPGGILTDNVV